LTTINTGGIKAADRAEAAAARSSEKSGSGHWISGSRHFIGGGGHAPNRYDLPAYLIRCAFILFLTMIRFYIFTQYEPDEAHPYGQVQFAGFGMAGAVLLLNEMQ